MCSKNVCVVVVFIRLFFGGFYRIKVENLRLIETKQNFEEFIAVLWYFDCMITGGALKGIKINVTDILIIKHLINDTLNRAPTTTTLDKYVYATFAAFTQHKKICILDLPQLYDSADQRMRQLIVYPMDQREYNKGNKRDDKDFSNLFRSEIFGIFKNIKTLIIITTNDTGFRSYSLSMTTLLSLISSSSLDQIIIKSVEYYGSNWINKLWRSDDEIMKKEYAAKHYSISMKKEKSGRYNEYWFVIKCTE